MQRLELLRKLKEYLEADRFAIDYYRTCDGRYCSVGYLLHLVGVSGSTLERLGSETYTSVIFHNPDLVSRLHELFTMEELCYLQVLNDAAGSSEGKRALLRYVDELMEREETDAD